MIVAVLTSIPDRPRCAATADGARRSDVAAIGCFTRLRVFSKVTP